MRLICLSFRPSLVMVAESTASRRDCMMHQVERSTRLAKLRACEISYTRLFGGFDTTFAEDGKGIRNVARNGGKMRKHWAREGLAYA